MSIGTEFEYNKIISEEKYIINYCNEIFEKLNYKKNIFYKGMPEKMAFETEIWIVGESIRQGIINEKKNKTNNYLKIIDDIIEIINTCKFKSGRESFVMLLSFYKNNEIVNETLVKLLNENELYGFAIKELDKIKEYGYINEIVEIYNNEKKGWIKQIAKKYIEKQLQTKNKEIK